MNNILQYLKAYWHDVDKRILTISIVFIALAIYLNYATGLEKIIQELPELQQYLSWLLIFLCAFAFPYVVQLFLGKANLFTNKIFLGLLFFAPAVFAWKMSANFHVHAVANRSENTYWNLVLYWPFKLMITSIALYVVWKLLQEKQPLYGLSAKRLYLKPYLLMLLIMVPLIALASTRPDFLAVYPKLKNVGFLNRPGKGWYQFLYELSYGSDFFTIEFFFRGFLVLAFSKWVGKDAILPMALFYCTIHFGKPLGECISSFFGGLILGVITYHTRTIYGGLIVHLGIAWMMELGGYLGA